MKECQSVKKAIDACHSPRSSVIDRIGSCFYVFEMVQVHPSRNTYICSSCRIESGIQKETGSGFRRNGRGGTIIRLFGYFNTNRGKNKSATKKIRGAEEGNSSASTPLRERMISAA